LSFFNPAIDIRNATKYGCSFQRNEKIGLLACGSKYRLRHTDTVTVGIHLVITQVFLHQSPRKHRAFQRLGRNSQRKRTKKKIRADANAEAKRQTLRSDTPQGYSFQRNDKNRATSLRQ